MLYVLVRWLVQISAEVQNTLTADSCFPVSLQDNPGVGAIIKRRLQTLRVTSSSNVLHFVKQISYHSIFLTSGNAYT
jgi:hypothetical protein